MKKLFKSLVVTIAIALSVTCMAMFITACDGNKDKENFVITVLYPNGEAVNGTADGTAGMDSKSVMIQICQKDDPTACYKMLQLGADGTVKVSIADVKNAIGEGNYIMHIQGVPQGYTYDEDNYVLNTETTAVTVNLVNV